MKLAPWIQTILGNDMKEQIQDLIKRYTNHLNSWKDSLRTYKNGLEKADKDDTQLIRYWKDEIRNAETKIETHQQMINDLKSLIN